MVLQSLVKRKRVAATGNHPPFYSIGDLFAIYNGRTDQAIYLRNVERWSIHKLKRFCYLRGVDSGNLPRQELIKIAVMELSLLHHRPRPIENSSLAKSVVVLPAWISLKPYGYIDWHQQKKLKDKISWIYTINRQTKITILPRFQAKKWEHIMDQFEHVLSSQQQNKRTQIEKQCENGYIMITRKGNIIISILDKYFMLRTNIQRIRYNNDVLIEKFRRIVHNQRNMGITYSHGYVHYKETGRATITNYINRNYTGLFQQLQNKDRRPTDHILIEPQRLTIHHRSKISNDATPLGLSDTFRMFRVGMDITCVNIIGDNKYMVVHGVRNNNYLEVFIINLLTQERFMIECPHKSLNMTTRTSYGYMLSNEVLLVFTNTALMVPPMPQHQGGISILTIHLAKQRWEVLQLRLPIGIEYRVININASNYHHRKDLISMCKECNIRFPEHMYSLLMQWIPKDIVIMTYSEVNGQQEWVANIMQLLNEAFEIGFQCDKKERGNTSISSNRNIWYQQDPAHNFYQMDNPWSRARQYVDNSEDENKQQEE